ncbi:YCF48-related protein [uncultured Tenacibaculum sp.]|uniref:WD40/YVTN/BNR-like repeat-containing protein n=1 Tax=uncultured Tenacibaculum sp. TaxID=174713 RepID=UPI00261235B4|nr:YCF48-related protein [uncultured Tenacibaculum sp.]
MKYVLRMLSFFAFVFVLQSCSEDVGIVLNNGFDSISKEWKKLDIGTTETLNKIHFINKSEGFIIGNKGKLFKTENGGIDWKEISSGVTHDLVSISFNGKNKGVINGLSTIDGGKNWKVVNTTSSYYCYYASEDVMIGGSNSSFAGTVYRSTDDGVTWTDVYKNPHTGFYTSAGFMGDTGYLSSWYSGRILKTTDKGKTWTVAVEGTAKPTGGKNTFDDFFNLTVVNAKTLYAVSNSYLSKSNDGGATFKIVYEKPSPTSGSLRGLYVNNEQIVLTDLTGNIFVSKNGGKDWGIKQPKKSVTFNDVYVANGIAYAVGTKGELWRKNIK